MDSNENNRYASNCDRTREAPTVIGGGNLRRHVNGSECGVCHLVVRGAKNFRRHAEIHDNPCSRCKKNFDYNFMLEAHQCSPSSERPSSHQSTIPPAYYWPFIHGNPLTTHPTIMPPSRSLSMCEPAGRKPDPTAVLAQANNLSLIGKSHPSGNSDISGTQSSQHSAGENRGPPCSSKSTARPPGSESPRETRSVTCPSTSGREATTSSSINSGIDRNPKQTDIYRTMNKDENNRNGSNCDRTREAAAVFGEGNLRPHVDGSECGVCHMVVRGAENFLKHGEIHNNPCPRCKKNFDYKFVLEVHQCSPSSEMSSSNQSTIPPAFYWPFTHGNPLTTHPTIMPSSRSLSMCDPAGRKPNPTAVLAPASNLSHIGKSHPSRNADISGTQASQHSAGENREPPCSFESTARPTNSKSPQGTRSVACPSTSRQPSTSSSSINSGVDGNAEQTDIYRTPKRSQEPPPLGDRPGSGTHSRLFDDDSDEEDTHGTRINFEALDKLLCSTNIANTSDSSHRPAGLPEISGAEPQHSSSIQGGADSQDSSPGDSHAQTHPDVIPGIPSFVDKPGPFANPGHSNSGADHLSGSSTPGGERAMPFELADEDLHGALAYTKRLEEQGGLPAAIHDAADGHAQDPLLRNPKPHFSASQEIPPLNDQPMTTARAEYKGMSTAHSSGPSTTLGAASYNPNNHGARNAQPYSSTMQLAPPHDNQHRLHAQLKHHGESTDNSKRLSDTFRGPDILIDRTNTQPNQITAFPGFTKAQPEHFWSNQGHAGRGFDTSAPWHAQLALFNHGSHQAGRSGTSETLSENSPSIAHGSGVPPKRSRMYTHAPSESNGSP